MDLILDADEAAGMPKIDERGLVGGEGTGQRGAAALLRVHTVEDEVHTVEDEEAAERLGAARGREEAVAPPRQIGGGGKGRGGTRAAKAEGATVSRAGVEVEVVPEAPVGPVVKLGGCGSAAGGFEDAESCVAAGGGKSCEAAGGTEECAGAPAELVGLGVEAPPEACEMKTAPGRGR